MKDEKLIEETLKEFNLPKVDFEESYLSEVIIPSIDLLTEYKNENDMLDFENVLKTLMLILNRMFERAIHLRSHKIIVLTSTIMWHSVINKNVEGVYIMQIPLKDMIGGNITAVHSLREELFIKDRKYEDIDDFLQKLYQKPPIWQIFKEAVIKLNSKATLGDIKNYIIKIYDDIPIDSIQQEIYAFCVNCKQRFRFSYNKSPRLAISKYDVLYNPKNNLFELYKAEQHGIWEIIEESDKIICNQRLSVDEYQNLKEFLINKKDNTYVCSATLFLFSNIEKKFHTDKKIWDGIQIFLNEISGDTPKATLKTELIRHSESSDVSSKRKDLFFDVREGNPNEYTLLERVRIEIEEFLTSISSEPIKSIEKKPIPLPDKEKLIEIEMEEEELVEEVDENLEVIYENTNILENIKDALLIKKQIILMGPPGTSKSYLADQIALLLTNGKRNNIGFVQFHPSYSYEDFVECNNIESGKDEGALLIIKPQEKIFRKFCRKAVEKEEENFIFIIDEINRGNVERIFGELIYCLENRNKRVISVYFQDRHFYIPENVLIISTMNTVDLSIANIDAALRRRFYIIELMPNSNILKNWLDCTLGDLYPKFQEILVNFLNNLNKLIENHHLIGKFRTIGHAFFMLKKIHEKASLSEIWRNLEMEWKFAIRPTLLEYLNFSEKDLIVFDNEFEKFSNQIEERIENEILISTKETKIGGMELKGTPLKKYKFWTGLLKKIKEGDIKSFSDKKPVGEGNIYYTTNKNCYLSLVITLKQARVEWSIDSTDADWNKKLFRDLEKYKININESFGSELNWNFDEERRTQKITTVVSDSGLSQEEKWEEIQELMIENMNKLENALKPYLVSDELI